MERMSKVFVTSAIVVVLVVGFLTKTLLAKQEGVKRFSEAEIAQKSGDSVRDQCQSIGELSNTEVVQKIKKLQIPFIANNGQTDDQVRFYANTFGGTVFVTECGKIVYSLSAGNNEALTECSPLKRGVGGVSNCAKQVPDCSIPRSEVQNRSTERSRRSPKSEIKGLALKEELVGGKVSHITGEGESVAKVNYFRGNDPAQWKTNIATYEMVSLGEVYKGIDLKLKAHGNTVEKFFYVKPGAEPDNIRLSLNGNKFLRINKDGQLVVKTARGDVKFSRPVAYQEIDGMRVAVEVAYRFQGLWGGDQESKNRRQKSESRSQNIGTNPLNQKLVVSEVEPSAMHNRSTEHSRRSPKSKYGFKVASYDKTQELIIDPLLASTFLGGNDKSDQCFSIAVDSSGNIYVAGRTTSEDFPTTTGAYDTSIGDESSGTSDGFISKFDGNLTTLIASTF